MSKVVATLYDPARDLRLDHVEDDWSGDTMDLEYMWTEGNYSCDCNRRLFMCRALGEPEPARDECGDSIRLERLTLDGVEVMLSELAGEEDEMRDR